jgi:hypothetical protein
MPRGASEGEEMGGRTDERRRRFWVDQRPGYNYGFPFRRRGGYYVTRRSRRLGWWALAALVVVVLLWGVRG